MVEITDQEFLILWLLAGVVLLGFFAFGSNDE